MARAHAHEGNAPCLLGHPLKHMFTVVRDSPFSTRPPPRRRTARSCWVRLRRERTRARRT
eukprot:1235747-Pyramimonas_sp.AAC.1